MSYDNIELLDMLMELDIEQIKEVRKRYEELYQGKGGTYTLVCNYAISLKRAGSRRKIFVSLIEQVKNAPSDATNTERGKIAGKDKIQHYYSRFRRKGQNNVFI